MIKTGLLLNIDSQVKQKKIVEQAKQNQLAFTRLMALFGDYICVYVINLKDNSYIQYQASAEFEEIGVQTEGEDFGCTRRPRTI